MARLLRRHLKAVVCGYAVTALAVTALAFVLGVRSSDRTGLNRSVYPEVRFGGAPLLEDVSRDVTLDFLDEDPELPRRYFSTRWMGYWYVPREGNIRLEGTGDDRLDVWVDGELVLRRTPPADMHTASRALALEAGVHRILVEYQQHGGARALRLRWAPDRGRARAFEPYRLFHEWPTLNDVRLAERASRLRTAAFVLWATPIAVLLGWLTGRVWKVLNRFGPQSGFGRRWETGLRVAVALGVGAVAIRALLARLPGWNPESLWIDDVFYAAIVRADLWSMITAPVHVAPGLFIVWRVLYAVFPDPEWSLQLLPLGCGLAAIPVMALAVRKLTRDDGLALLAAAATALNPLLAYYMVFVHQYTFEFLLTAVFLLAAVGLFGNGPEIEPRRFARVAALGAVALFFAIPSVFVSFPIVNLGAAVTAPAWFRDRGRTVSVLCSAAAYNTAVLAAYLFFRGRTNDLLVSNVFASGFMSTESAGAAWRFLAANGRRLLEMSLPRGPEWDLSTMSWALPFVGLGLVWLLARPATRLVGLAVGGIYAAFVTASALYVYPLGTGRPDIFAFPVAICLLCAGIHCATAALPKGACFRLFAGLTLAAVAVMHPRQVEYRARNDSRLIDHLEERVQPDDGLILTWPAAFLTAFYGQIPFEVIAYGEAPLGARVTIVRDRTLHMPAGRDGVTWRAGTAGVEQFLDDSRPGRIWFVAYHAFPGSREDVRLSLEAAGYTVQEATSASRGALYLALAAAETRP